MENQKELPEPQFVVSAWSHPAAASYTFGPFKSEDAAYRFANTIPASYEGAEVLVLNHPRAIGTGNEQSFQ